MKAGITATREGLTEKQKDKLRMHLRRNKPDEFHHGGCEGGDTEASWIAFKMGIKVVCHPPLNSRFVGDYYADVVLPPKEYIARNHDIVDVVDVMYGCPKGIREQKRGSGTWATIRYTRKRRKSLEIIWPY